MSKPTIPDRSPGLAAGPAGVHFPRQLEADGTASALRPLLAAHTGNLWPGSTVEVPVIAMSELLGAVLRSAALKGFIRCGLEAITEKLEQERSGIAHVQRRDGLPPADRISRLLFFSNDGAGRFYRQVGRLLQTHAPRVLGCRLDIDGATLGAAVTGRNRMVRVIMVEHKDAVSDVLRAVVAAGERR